MGRLLGLELYNFKSYKGVVKIGFGNSNFTSIIGPNGSGKSNMMDAISFVLGVRSSQLRSNASIDLIYRGIKDNNEDENDAYVKAYYQQNDANEPTNIIEFMRKILPNGETNYFVDSKQVTFNKYSELLANENILIKAKNFLVFQGDVEQIASQSPIQLTNMLETVSGSIQYKKDYDSLKDTLEYLNQSTAEAIRTRRRIHMELKTYKDGITRDKEYKSTLKKRQNNETVLALWKLYHLQLNKNDLITKLSKYNDQLLKLSSQVNKHDEKIKIAKKNFNQKNSILLKQQNKLNYKLKEKNSLDSNLKLIKLPQRSLIRKINQIENRIEVLTNEMKRQERNVERFTQNLDIVKDTKIKFETNLLTKNENYEKFKLNDEDLLFYKELNEKYLIDGGSHLEEKIALLNNDKNELNNEMNLVKRKIDISKERIDEELLVNMEELELQKNDLTSQLNDKNSINSTYLKDLKFYQSEIESKNNQEYDLNYKLRDTLLKIDELNATKRETLRERKLRENVATLKRLFPGVRGIVHDLCHPKKDRYAVAVSTILGRNFDSIIVDTQAVAQECISYLKKQRAGSASFIPLDTVESESAMLPAMDGHLKGEYLLTRNAIEYEPEYERAMQYVCSDSIICSNLEVAKNLKWKYNVRSKLVTVDGELIHRAGLMTGGVSKEGNNRWDKEEYQSLLTLKDTLLEKIETVSNEARTASMKARDLEGNIALLNTEIVSIRDQLTQIGRSINELNIELKYQRDLIKTEYEPRQHELERKISECDTKITSLLSEKENLQSAIFEGFTTRMGFTVQEYESYSGSVMRQQNKELQVLQKEILTIENKLQFENERLSTTKKRFEKANSDLEIASTELKSLELKEKEHHENTENIGHEIEEQEALVKSTQHDVDTKQLEINNLEESFNDLTASYQNFKHEKDEIGDDVEKLDLARLGILKNCKISNIEIPVSSEKSLADIPITSNEKEALKISNEVDIDYNRLPNKYKDNHSDRMKTELENNIKEVDEVLKVLQPNARAVERYEEAQSRFEGADQETEELKTEERKVHSEFIKIKKSRKELFEKTFEHINKHLDGIYRELTRNTNSPAELSGGNASLTLEDEDEPFNAGTKYHATPPSKRFKDMEYLSGGEKTIAALALLFAINSYRPSPFFVLDEVDAALDIKNVERIASYIRKHGNPSLQFIVISLKNTMFEKSDALVGVYRQQKENASRVVTLDLSQYAD
ncbi:structural maintenance of chromosomes protein 1 [Monosporozyma servazzii]